MQESLILLALEDTIWSRLGVGAVAIILGLAFIFAGIENIKTRRAEETGSRRLVNSALGRSNTYKGKTAVAVGWMRVVGGVCVILFGIFFLIVGPILAR